MVQSMRPTDDPNLRRIQANVAKMRAQGAPEADVMAYLQHEDSLATATPPAPPAAGLSQHGAIRTFVDNLANGELFGVGPRLQAVAASIANSHDHDLSLYHFYLDALQQQQGVNARAHPVAAVSGGLTGAITSPLNKLLPAPRAGASLLRQAGRAALGGGIAGTVAGAGSAPYGQTGRGALFGGGAGLVLGAGAPLLGEAGRVFPRGTGAVLGAGLGAAATPDNRLAGAIGGGTAGFFGAQAIVNALTRRAGGQVASVNPIVPPSDAARVSPAMGRAERTLLRWVTRNGTTPGNVLDDLATRPTDQPVTIMELGGEPVQRLARAARGVSPSAGKRIGEALVERAQGGLGRTLGILEKHLGVERGNFLETADDIATNRAALANPLYQDAYAAPPIPASASTTFDGEAISLADLLARPSVKQALGFAKTIAAERGAELPDIADGGAVPVKTVDLIKKSLDDMLGFAKSRGTLPDGSAATREKLNAINQTRRALLKLTDEQVPAYGQARQVFAGQAALGNALEDGRTDFLKLTPGAVQRAVAGLTQGEREMYLKGALEAVAEKLGGKPRASDFVKAIRDNNTFEPRFRALFPSDAAFRAFTKELEQEGQFAQTLRTVTGGSQTADKLADQELLGIDVAKAAQDVKGGLSAAALRKILGAIETRRRVQSAAQAGALAPFLTAGARDRADLLRVIGRLAEAQRRAEQQAAIAQRAGVGSGVVGGGLLGRP